MKDHRDFSLGLQSCTRSGGLQSCIVCIVYLPLGVAEDDGLCDGQSVVQITQSVKLPLLSLHSHEELLYTLQSQLITGGDRQRNRWC